MAAQGLSTALLMTVQPVQVELLPAPEIETIWPKTLILTRTAKKVSRISFCNDFKSINIISLNPLPD